MIVKIVKCCSSEDVELHECFGCKYSFGDKGRVTMKLLDEEGSVLRQESVVADKETTVYFLENGQTVDSFKIGPDKK